MAGIVELHNQMLDEQDALRETTLKRDEMIVIAMDGGVPTARIAKELSISPQRVHQIAQRVRSDK